MVQLCHPDLVNEFPPLRTTTTVAAVHLPVQLTSFVGRDAEMDEVRELLADNRVVTLTGAGGVGKTRLACRSRPSWPASSPTGCGMSIWRRSPTPSWWR